MSAGGSIEEAVLAFLWRIRMKEAQSPELRFDALTLANRIVESSGGEAGFVTIKRLRAMAEGKNGLSRRDIETLRASRDALAVEVSQRKFDRKRLTNALTEVKSMKKNLRVVAVERDDLRRKVRELREKLNPKTVIPVERGRKLVMQ